MESGAWAEGRVHSVVPGRTKEGDLRAGRWTRTHERVMESRSSRTRWFPEAHRRRRRFAGGQTIASRSTESSPRARTAGSIRSRPACRRLLGRTSTTRLGSHAVASGPGRERRRAATRVGRRAIAFGGILALAAVTAVTAGGAPGARGRGAAAPAPPAWVFPPPPGGGRG